MRVLKNVLRALALLAWSAISVGQQEAAPPPAPPRPEPRVETPAPPPADRDAPAPPREASGNADEREFIPTEELAPDAAVTFPVDI